MIVHDGNAAKPRELRFTVPGQPRTWKRTNTYRGAKITPKEQRAYQQAIQWSAIAAIKSRSRWDLAARFAVEIDVYSARRAGDLDNFSKNVCDAGNGVLWGDDRQIDELTIRRHVDKDAPRLEVVVRALELGRAA